MPQAAELLRQGRDEELWQMCCGFLSLNLEQFMAVQKRLLMEQIELLSRSSLGARLMRGTKPRSVEEFRQLIPLTTYADYSPELVEKRVDTLPAEPATWVHTSGRSGDYPCKWVPISSAYANELSVLLLGVGILAACNGWGDVSSVKERSKVIYTVAPRHYMSGAMAHMTLEQTTVICYPPLIEAEGLPFDERIRLAFKHALSHGIDYFFGLSLILVAVGNKFTQSAGKRDIRPLLSQPRALLRLTKGMVKSRLAGRPMLPKDLWSVKGIVCGGLDSGVYKERIKQFWGRYPLDIYASTEGGLVATQTWDYDGMTFIPNLNFLEFIPEKEYFKWQLDPSYQPRTVLLDEVEPGENYELVTTSFHGGAMVRYRVGDMVRITSLRNENLGIAIPQMVFERRADGLLDFVVIRLTEKTIWQAIENAGIAYEDWTAYKKPGEPVLHLLIEPNGERPMSESQIEMAVYEQLLRADNDSYATSRAHDDLADMIKFQVKVTLLPQGAFVSYTAQRLAEGADLAHLKPLHINPSEKVLSALLAKPEVVPEVRVPTRERAPA